MPPSGGETLAHRFAAGDTCGLSSVMAFGGETLAHRFAALRL